MKKSHIKSLNLKPGGDPGRRGERGDAGVPERGGGHPAFQRRLPRGKEDPWSCSASSRHPGGLQGEENQRKMNAVNSHNFVQGAAGPARGPGL